MDRLATRRVVVHDDESGLCFGEGFTDRGNEVFLPRGGRLRIVSLYDNRIVSPDMEPMEPVELSFFLNTYKGET